MTPVQKPTKEHLPPVSYEALAENNRHTHANLNVCIQERERMHRTLWEIARFIEERHKEGDTEYQVVLLARTALRGSGV